VNLLFALVVLSQAPQPGALPPNHPPLSNPSPVPSAQALLKTLDATPGLKDQDKPFEIAASLGRVYAGQARHSEARGFYEQAMQKAEPVRTLYAARRKAAGTKPLPDPATVGCATGADTSLDSLFQLAKARADAAGAASCARAALLVTQDVDVQFGNLLFVMRDAPAALAVFTRALDTFDENLEARYARAALLLDTRGDDLATLTTVKADLERVVKQAKLAPRVSQARRLLERATEALAQGGMSKLVAAAAPPTAPTPEPQPNVVQPPALSPEMVKAFNDAPRTAEMEQGFAKAIDDAEEHLARGRFNEARASYLQVMPYQPNNLRLRAGMAWTMLRLNRQPMADNVWRAAIENPDAVSALGDTLKAKGDVQGAQAVWAKLRESVPSYAPRLEGKR
jgi:tetratricopeptide (TPR) repeat protein